MCIDRILDYLRLSDNLATSGQPTAEQFNSIAASGYETVINLALPTSSNAIADEPGVVARCGMDYISIPIVWEEPTLEDFQTFCDVMKEQCDRKVWVHCAANKRVSAFIYLYRQIVEQISIQHILSEVTIQSFNVGILSWFTWLDILNIDLAVAILLKSLGDKLRSIIYSDTLRKSSFFVQLS